MGMAIYLKRRARGARFACNKHTCHHWRGKQALQASSRFGRSTVEPVGISGPMLARPRPAMTFSPLASSRCSLGFSQVPHLGAQGVHAAPWHSILLVHAAKSETYAVPDRTLLPQALNDARGGPACFHKVLPLLQDPSCTCNSVELAARSCNASSRSWPESANTSCRASPHICFVAGHPFRLAIRESAACCVSSSQANGEQSPRPKPSAQNVEHQYYAED